MMNEIRDTLDRLDQDNLSTLMDRVCDEHQPTQISCKGREPVVMLSLTDYQNLVKGCVLPLTEAECDFVRSVHYPEKQ